MCLEKEKCIRSRNVSGEICLEEIKFSDEKWAYYKRSSFLKKMYP